MTMAAMKSYHRWRLSLGDFYVSVLHSSFFYWNFFWNNFSVEINFWIFHFIKLMFFPSSIRLRDLRF
jgi:hypothetical protein